MRSILSLDKEELTNIMNTGKLPEGISLGGIEERPDFNTLYRWRANPSRLAKELLKSRGDLSDVEKERLKLREIELDIKKEKAKTHTTALKDIKAQLNRIETKVDYLITLHSKEE